MRKLLVLPALLLVHCREAPRTHRWSAMDCNMAVTLYGNDAAKDGERFAAVERETERLESLFSDFRPESALSAVRGESGDTVEVDPEIEAVLALAMEMGEASGGSFDITLHDLKALWGIGSGRHPHVPDSAAIDSVMRGNPTYGARPGTPWKPPLILLGKGRVLLKRRDTPLDLGGIAKGYAVDRLAALLDSLGSTGHLVQAGGEIVTGGRKPEGDWRVGIRHPRFADSVGGLLSSANPMAISTSGDYERYFVRDGVRYHHLFDPRTGRPATSACAVTVVAGSGLLTDALTKPLFLLGPGPGAALARRFGARAVWFLATPEGVCARPMPEMKGWLHLQGTPLCGDGATGTGEKGETRT